MSRIGNKPVNLPAGVTVNVTKDNVVSVKGPLGELVQRGTYFIPPFRTKAS